MRYIMRVHLLALQIFQNQSMFIHGANAGVRHEI